MDISVLLAIFIIIACLLWRLYQNPRIKYPPGPMGLPIVGYLPFLGEYTHETLLQLGKKYGSIFSLTLGNERVVVLNDWAAVKAALVDQSQTFSGRPSMFVFDANVKKRDVATKDGPVWLAQRRLTIQALKIISSGKSDRNFLYLNSATKLIKKFERNNGQVVCIKDDLFTPIFNIVWKLTCNKTIEDDDEKARKFYEILKGNFRGFRNNSPINFMPYLRYLIPGGCGYWTYQKYHNMLWSYLETELEEHLQTYKEGEIRDFLDVHIEELNRKKRNNEKIYPPYTLPEIVGSLYDMFLAGTETTSTTLTWAILLLSTYPKIQQKLQEELDEVIGQGRLPTLDDAQKLPYLDAVTMEIHRFATLVPLSLLHSAIKDTEVLGQPIPKGCKIIQHIYGVHRDPKCWENPNEFRPERFYDSENKVKKPEYLIPFSVGARICLGEAQAKQMVFLFIASIFQKLQFELPPNLPQPSLEPFVGLTLMPKPFSVLIKTR